MPSNHPSLTEFGQFEEQVDLLRGEIHRLRSQTVSLLTAARSQLADLQGAIAELPVVLVFDWVTRNALADPWTKEEGSSFWLLGHLFGRVKPLIIFFHPLAMGDLNAGELAQRSPIHDALDGSSAGG